MKEKIPILALAILLIIVATSLIAKPVDVLLYPAQYGKPSRAVPIVKNRPDLPEVMPVLKRSFEEPLLGPLGVNWVLSYDNGTEASSLGGLAAGFHLGVWFQSPSACTLLQVYYLFADGGAVTYYVTDPADTIDFVNDYEEYHGGVNAGPSPIETYLHPEEAATAPDGWDTLDVTAMPDVEKNVFFAAYIMDDGNSSPIIDASISPPYHTIMQRSVAGGPFGWYSSWHHVYIRALVRMYENPPPSVIAYDNLGNSYVTTGREVTATFSDLGIPLDSTGVTEAWLYYTIDGGALDSLSMTLISGDNSYGVWKAILPGINAGQTMEYYFTCYDMQGLSTTDPNPATPASYTIREKTGDVLFVNDDYYGGDYSFDVISDVIPTADQWDIPSDGAPDNSDMLAGYDVIIWNSWEYSGASFAAAQSLVEDYLDGGGNLLVSGMDIIAGEFGYSWGDYTTVPGDFLYDYFGIRGGTDDYAPDYISIYYGRTNDDITAVFNEDWPITSFPYYWVGPGYNYAGKFDEDPDTTQWRGILYDEWGNCSAFRYELAGAYKVVWLYFPFAYIADYNNLSSPEIQQQQELIGRILKWFDNTPAPALLGLPRHYSTVTSGPYPVTITVTNFVEPILSVDLIISANGVEDTIPMIPLRSGVDYAADIPAYTVTTDIYYHVEAMDADSMIASSVTYNFWFLVPTADVLYVNESGSSDLDYMDVLDSLGISGGYDVYDPAVQGVPDATVLPSYSTLVWNGDCGYGTILTKESDGNVLYDYMISGGNIFFNSDEILGLWDGWSDVDYVEGEFPYDVLKVNHIYNDVCYDSVYGVTGDIISDGIIAEMTFPPTETNWNDEVGIDTSATEILTDILATTIRGLRWDDADNKVVFIPFMYVSLPKTDQITILGNALTWFGTTLRFSSDDVIDTDIPKIFALSQNRPNPFNRRTNILYSIPSVANVSLKIYNAAGQLIRTLVDGTEEPGYKSVSWDGLDRNNKRVAQGVYFYKLSTGNFRATKKLLIVR